MYDFTPMYYEMPKNRSVFINPLLAFDIMSGREQEFNNFFLHKWKEEERKGVRVKRFAKPILETEFQFD